jgi:hypothetical protein
VAAECSAVAKDLATSELAPRYRYLGVPTLPMLDARHCLTRGLPLADGEVVIWRCGALRYVGRSTVGGTLFLTDKRLLFAPNWASVGNRKLWGADREEIRSVRKSGRSLRLPDEELRRCLKVVTRAQHEESFIVNSLGTVVAELLTLLRTEVVPLRRPSVRPVSAA